MEGLPFAVVHGEWIWRGALLLFLGGGVAWAWARPRRAARAGWREALGRVGRPTAPLEGRDGDAIAITGRLEAEESAPRFEDAKEVAAAGAGPPGHATASARAGRLVVVTEGGRVELEGDVELLAGSEELWPGRPPRKLSPEVRERLGSGVDPSVAAVFRSVRAGDRVRAAGVLRIRSSKEEQGYREQGRRFLLEQATVASETPPRVRGPSRVRALSAAAVAGLLFLLVFGAGGAILDGVSKKEREGIEHRPLAEFLRGRLATRALAATPFHRARALDRLAHALSYRGAPSLEVREALVALGEIRGDCAGAMEVMVRHRQFGRALERKQTCGGDRAAGIAADAALAIGEIEQASRLLAGLEDRGFHYERLHAIRVHLLAGELAEAAAAASGMAAWYRGPEDWIKTDEKAVAFRAHRAQVLDCLAERVRDAGPRGRLEALVRESGPHECRLLLADLAAGSERESLLAPGAEELDWRLKNLTARLRAESAPDGAAAQLARFQGSQLPSALLGYAHHLESGLERSILDALRDREDLSPAAEVLRANLVARAVLAEALVGRFEDSRRLLATLGESEDDPNLPDQVALGAFVELRAGDLAAARAVLDRGAGAGGYDRRMLGDHIAALERKEAPGEDAAGLISAEVLSEALRGDGRRLAEKLREHHYQGLVLPRLAPVAFWLPAEPLAECLKLCRPLGSELRGPVAGVVQHLADLAVVAEAAGEAGLAGDLRAGAQRIHDASLRREIAVPLAVLEAL